jgi:hypothetical protein
MIVPGIQELAKKQEDFLLHEMHYDENGLDIQISGDTPKLFYCALIRMFRSLGGKNFITTTVSYKASKYEISIINFSGNDDPDTPSKKIIRLEEENKHLQEEIKNLRLQIYTFSSI